MKQGVPKISVVLPVYNGRRYLKTSIESVLNQTHRDFELIIWDDGSTDETVALMAGYLDSRVRRFASDRNRGLFTTLNLAIQQSKGEYIRLWSQDDVMKPNCLERQLAFLERNTQLAMVYCMCDKIGDDQQVAIPADFKSHPKIIDPQVASEIMFHHGSITGNIANVMLRKSALNDVGLFREDLLVSGDFEMWVRLTERWPIGFLDESLMYLRIHKEQFSRRSGLFPTFMREDGPIFETLIGRLPSELKDHAKRYDRRHRQLNYFRYFVRSLLVLDWRTAAEAYRQIRRFSPFVLFWLWLLTIDRRLFKVQPKYSVQSAKASDSVNAAVATQGGVKVA